MPGPGKAVTIVQPMRRVTAHARGKGPPQSTLLPSFIFRPQTPPGNPIHVCFGKRTPFILPCKPCMIVIEGRRGLLLRKQKLLRRASLFHTCGPAVDLIPHIQCSITNLTCYRYHIQEKIFACQVMLSKLCRVNFCAANKMLLEEPRSLRPEIRGSMSRTVPNG